MPTSENQESDHEDEVPEEDSETVDAASEDHKDEDDASQTPAPEPEPETPPPSSAMSNDPRYSRLLKMQSSYVTEESLASTAPKPPDPPEEGEFDDDEFHDDEFHDDEEYHEDDDFDDDEEHEHHQNPPAEAAQEEEAEPSPPPEDDKDHRMARLRKLRSSYVKEEDLKATPSSNEYMELFGEEEQLKVVCPQCHSEEPRGNRICGNCGAKLPKLTSVSEMRYAPGSKDKGVKKFFDAVKRLHDNDMEIDEFLEFIEGRLARAREFEESLGDLLDESDSDSWIPKASQLLKDAIVTQHDLIEGMYGKVNDMLHDDEVEHEDYEIAMAENPEEPPQQPLSLPERIAFLNFDEELNGIKATNDQMLEALSLIDQYQKKSREELEVSM